MIIDMLTKNSVSIKKQTETGIWRKAYVNSEQSRQELQTEVPEPYLSEILEVWGDAPTVIEEVPESQEPISNKPTEIEILQTELANTNAMLLDFMESMLI